MRRVLPAPRRNRLGAVTAGVVALGAAAAIVPATAPAGLLLCLAAIVPAIVAVRRSRNGRATNGRLSLASLVMAPVFFLVAFVVVRVTAPPAPARQVTDVAALPVATVPATTAVASTLPQADHGTSRGARACSRPQRHGHAGRRAPDRRCSEPLGHGVRSVLGRWRGAGSACSLRRGHALPQRRRGLCAASGRRRVRTAGRDGAVPRRHILIQPEPSRHLLGTRRSGRVPVAHRQGTGRR